MYEMKMKFSFVTLTLATVLSASAFLPKEENTIKLADKMITSSIYSIEDKMITSSLPKPNDKMITSSIYSIEDKMITSSLPKPNDKMITS